MKISLPLQRSSKPSHAGSDKIPVPDVLLSYHNAGRETIHVNMATIYVVFIVFLLCTGPFEEFDQSKLFI